MDENTVFFVRYLDTREIEIRSVTKEGLKNIYGHTEIREGMVLEQEDTAGNPATEVVKILKGDLARKWEAIVCLEDAFMGVAEPLLTDFINAILIEVHKLYREESVRPINIGLY